jgi:RNA polymerase-binding transcription factor DksA
MLNEQQIAALKKALDDRSTQVREEIRHELLGSDNPKFIELAGQVHDREEESIADMLVDIQLQAIDRHVQEFRDIEAAIARMEAGEYEVCRDCGEDIPHARLTVQPTAQRCEPCQEEYERTHPETGRPKL